MSCEQRGKWLEKMAKLHKWKFGVEVGVWYGQTFFHLLDTVPGLLLVGVDIWCDPPPGVVIPHHQDQKENRKQVLERVDRLPRDKHGLIFEMPSKQAASSICDGDLDFVFIDADHSFEAVCADIKAWLPKVRQGGFITGHDYDMDGVRQAVNLLLPGVKVDDGSDFVWYWRVE